MAIVRNIIKASDNLLWNRKCIISGTNCLDADRLFGTKIEIPAPPKRPLTAYMIFCKENRQNILKENPSLSSPEQIKMLAKKWSHLSLEMKKPYEVSARESTLLYSEAHKKFYENLTEEQKEELSRLKAEKRESRRLMKLKKVLRDSGVPKTPISAYALFVQSQAKNKLGVDRAFGFFKKVAEMWKALPEESKIMYENQAQADKRRHIEELKAWRDKMAAEGKTDVIKAYEELKSKGRITESDHISHSKKKLLPVEAQSSKSKASKN